MKFLSRLSFASFLVLLFLSNSSIAQVLNSSQLDSLVEKTRRTFNVPGIALAIIHDGKVIHSKGYGIRSIANQKPVDEHTLFAIASNSKAFTATALAMLIDEGKLDWDTKVRAVIPEFTLYNPLSFANSIID